MRYSLHSAAGHRIGEAETAQGIADIAKHGTWAYDTNRSNRFPCVVFKDDVMGLVGTPYELRSEAMLAATKLVVPA